MQGRLSTVEAVRTFLMGGDATLTIKSVKTETRFTYRVSAPKTDEGKRDYNSNMLFVSLLNGSDNETDYQYFGQIRRSANGDRFEHGRKAKITSEAPSAKAFAWFAHKVLAEQVLPGAVEVWHEGKCCRCGRKLTVPESVSSGIGPDCAEAMGSRQMMMAF